MDTVDLVVIASVLILFGILAINVFDGRVFESPGLASGIGTIYMSIGGMYLLFDSNLWVGGACFFLSIAYLIQALSLKGRS